MNKREDAVHEALSLFIFNYSISLFIFNYIQFHYLHSIIMTLEYLVSSPLETIHVQSDSINFNGFFFLLETSDCSDESRWDET